MPFNAYKTVLGILMTLLQHFFLENHVIFNFNFTSTRATKTRQPSSSARKKNMCVFLLDDAILITPVLLAFSNENSIEMWNDINSFLQLQDLVLWLYCLPSNSMIHVQSPADVLRLRKKCFLWLINTKYFVEKDLNNVLLFQQKWIRKTQNEIVCAN